MAPLKKKKNGKHCTKGLHQLQEQNDMGLETNVAVGSKCFGSMTSFHCQINIILLLELWVALLYAPVFSEWTRDVMLLEML